MAVIAASAVLDGAVITENECQIITAVVSMYKA